MFTLDISQLDVLPIRVRKDFPPIHYVLYLIILSQAIRIAPEYTSVY